MDSKMESESFTEIGCSCSGAEINIVNSNCYNNNNNNNENVNKNNCQNFIRNRKKVNILLNESHQINCVKILIHKNIMIVHKSTDIGDIINEEEESSSEKMKKFKLVKKNINCINSFLELLLRIVILIIFIQLERTPAFKRKIQPEELYLYKYPHTRDIVSAFILLPASFIVPFTIILINYLITHDRHDFFQGNYALTLTLVLNGLITSLIKITVGRPRPDFFYRCFPNGTGFNDEMDCVGPTQLVNEGRKSFPSGHSSFPNISFLCITVAFAGFGFLFLYLSAKLHVFNERGRGRTWRLVITILPLTLATLVAISRTCDYHHHYEDVYIGSFIGMLISFICYRQYYPSIFNRNNPNKPFLYKVKPNTSLENCDDRLCEENPLIEDNKNNKWI